LSSHIAINRRIKWDEINFLEKWVIPNAIHPKSIINQEINQIIQTEDGEVEIMFNPTRSIILTDINNPARLSISRRFVSRRMTPETEIQDIRISETNILHPVYEQRNNMSPTKQRDNISQTSSEMSFHLN